MKIHITSLGCRLNQSEIESVSTLLLEQGHTITSEYNADIYIINSCAVTQRSERKTRHLINRARQALAGGPGGRIIVAGCATEAITSEKGIIHIPNDYKYLIPEIIADRLNPLDMESCEPSRFNYATPLRSSTNRVNLKIQDGCDNFCSYCIIPFMRGAPRSKPAHRVMEEFRELVENGYKEIILTGVTIGKYQHEGVRLHGLVENILTIPGQYRVHMTSMAPDMVTPELISQLKSDRVVRHLHLSLQSGSDSVLGRMNRKYSRSQYLELTQQIRQEIPDFNFTTDLIVGFPGETEKDFMDSLDLIRQVGFSHIHTFRFTPRPGTAAAGMDGAVEEIEKTRRSSEVISLCMELKREFYARFHKRDSLFLSERSRNGTTSGFNEYYVPIDVEESLPRNEFYKVTTRLDQGNHRLSGKVIEKQ